MSVGAALHKATNLSDVERRPHDFYSTPAEVTEALLDAEGSEIPQGVWEPAAGDGAISDVLFSRLFMVTESDIREEARGDTRSFYDYRHAPFDAIVTNPPFSECTAKGRCRWLWHALRLDIQYMALLLPSGWSYAQGCREFIDAWPPAREWKVAWRIDWTGGGASPANHAWMIWDRREPRRACWETGVLYREGGK